MAHPLHRVHPRAIPLSETVEGWLLVVGLLLAVWFVKTDVIATSLAMLDGYTELASFIAGSFFTSMLTTVPAIVALGEIAMHMSAWQVALYGGIGAVCGDLLVFRFVRSRLVEHILKAAIHPWMRGIGRKIAGGPLWWLGPILGAIIIASPLPDELGILVMGITNIKAWQFVPLALAANIAGVFAIATIAQQSL